MFGKHINKIYNIKYYNAFIKISQSLMHLNLFYKLLFAQVVFLFVPASDIL